MEVKTLRGRIDKALEEAGTEPALAAPAGEYADVVADLAAVAGIVGAVPDALEDEVVGVVPVRHDESLLVPTVIAPLQASFPAESSMKRTAAVPEARATFHWYERPVC